MSEFDEGMQDILSTFGMNEYSKKRIELIKSHTKDLMPGEFKKIVKHFLETKSVKYPPLPNDFLEQANVVVKSRYTSYKPNRGVSNDYGYSDTTIEEIASKYGAKTILDAVMSQVEKKHK